MDTGLFNTDFTVSYFIFFLSCSVSIHTLRTIHLLKKQKKICVFYARATNTFHMQFGPYCFATSEMRLAVHCHCQHTHTQFSTVRNYQVDLILLILRDSIPSSKSIHLFLFGFNGHDGYASDSITFDFMINASF